MTHWIQRELLLKPYNRGFHIITSEIVDALPEIKYFSVGMLHVFLQHTSASLTLNENADRNVRLDFESHFNNMIPENAHIYRHTDEGSDDMPAHLKASIMGCSLMIPVRNGQLGLGTWQGVYLCEHRNQGGRRRLLLTLQGLMNPEN